MTKITTFQKIQLYSSVIPYFSTLFVLIATVVELKNKKTSWIGWICLFLIIAIALFIYSAVSAVLSYDEFPVENTVAALIIFTVANTALVFLQLFSHNQAVIKKHHNYVTIAIIAVCTMFLVTAVVIIINKTISAPSHIEDINGSDNHLAIITMEEISTHRDVGTATMGGEGGYGNKSLVDGEYEIYDFENYSLKWKKLSGVFTLQATKVETDTLTLSVESVLTSGNAEILIFIDDQYYKHLPVGQDLQIVLESISGKTVIVKLAAESAEIELSISRT